MRLFKILKASLLLGCLSLICAPVEAQEGTMGEYLARAANCVACHSSPGGEAFAGGLKMATPIGNIYATNITPDTETGIGDYSLMDFDRAVRLGIAKDGHLLYPAMPYPSYAKLSSEDIAALYDFFMKEVPPIRQADLESEIPFPLNMRWPLAIWNFFFFEDMPYETDQSQSVLWNRGAYLVQGLGHCGACHTPRGWAWNEEAYDESNEMFLSGALLDHWFASNLSQDPNGGLGRWSNLEIVEYLRRGHNSISSSFGTMDEVIASSTQYLTEDDLNSMAVYLKDLPLVHEKHAKVFAYEPLAQTQLRNRDYSKPGALVYAQRCESCHVDSGMGYPPYIPPLAGNPVSVDSDPSSLINIVLNGSSRLLVNGLPDPYRMPGYRKLLTDDEIGNVVSFMRTSWGNKANPIAANEVAYLRELTSPVGDRIVILKMK